MAFPCRFLLSKSFAGTFCVIAFLNCTGTISIIFLHSFCNFSVLVIIRVSSCYHFSLFHNIKNRAIQDYNYTGKRFCACTCLSSGRFRQTLQAFAFSFYVCFPSSALAQRDFLYQFSQHIDYRKIVRLPHSRCHRLQSFCHNVSNNPIEQDYIRSFAIAPIELLSAILTESTSPIVYIVFKFVFTDRAFCVIPFIIRLHRYLLFFD